MNLETLDNYKKRTRKLIQLGGLVKKANFDLIEPALLLGVMIESKKSFDKLNEEQRQKLYHIGLNELKKKNSEQRKEATNKRRFSSSGSNEVGVDKSWLI